MYNSEAAVEIIPFHKPHSGPCGANNCMLKRQLSFQRLQPPLTHITKIENVIYDSYIQFNQRPVVVVCGSSWLGCEFDSHSRKIFSIFIFFAQMRDKASYSKTQRLQNSRKSGEQCLNTRLLLPTLSHVGQKPPRQKLKKYTVYLSSPL